MDSGDDGSVDEDDGSFDEDADSMEAGGMIA